MLSGQRHDDEDMKANVSAVGYQADCDRMAGDEGVDGMMWSSDGRKWLGRKLFKMITTRRPHQTCLRESGSRAAAFPCMQPCLQPYAPHHVISCSWRPSDSSHGLFRNSSLHDSHTLPPAYPAASRTSADCSLSHCPSSGSASHLTCDDLAIIQVKAQSRSSGPCSVSDN